MERLRHHPVLTSLGGSLITLAGWISLRDGIAELRGPIAQLANEMRDSPAAAVVLVVGLATVAYANWPWISARLAGPPPPSPRWPEDQDLIDTLDRWVSEQGYRTGNVGMWDGYDHAIDMTEELEGKPYRRIYIGKKNDARRISILASRSATEGAGKLALDQMSAEAQREMIAEMQLELGRSNVFFAGVMQPLNSVIVYKEFPFDDTLTEIEFTERVDEIRRADYLVSTIFSKATSQPSIDAPGASLSIPQIPDAEAPEQSPAT